MKNLRTLNLLAILAVASLFVKISGSTSLYPVLTGPDMAYIGSRVRFWCIARDSSPPVTYELVRDGGIPIDTNTDPQGDQTVVFVIKVTATSEGSYRCNAMAGGSTGVSNSIKLSVVTPPSYTKVTSEPFPPVAYEGSSFTLSCNVTKGSHLSYTWFFNRTEVNSSASPFLHLTGNKLVMGQVTPEHAGYYSCMAWSRVHNVRRFSSSHEVQVQVKVYVSTPRISFTISKEGDSYRGNVTCWSTRGSPPVNISLSLDDKEVGSVTATGPLAAWFPVAMVPGVDMGEAQCRVKTEVQELMSEPATLVVVPVGGDVKVEVEYLFRADSKMAAARLRCHVSRGTFPYISWLLNDSVLPETHVDSHIPPVLSHYTLADQRRTLVLSELSQEESGYYRCRARDSYDDSGPWVESAAVLVQATEVLVSTIEIIVIVLFCLLLLMIPLSVAFVCKMLYHEQAHTHIATTNSSSDALPLSPPTSQSGDNASSTDFDVQNQTVEISV